MQKIPKNCADFGRKSLKILVVENDQNFLDILKSYLHVMCNDSEIHCCASGSDALFCLHKCNYDLMIFDQGLEGSISGKRLWEICQKQFPSLPAILISGLSIEDFMKLFKSRTTYPSFLPKPFRTQELRAAMQDILADNGELKKAA